MKPYFESELGKLYHGDCLDVMPQLESVDLVLTDPPYGINWKCDYSSRIKKSPKAQGGNSCRSYKQIHGDDKPFDPNPFFAIKNQIFWGAPCFSKRLGNGSFLIWYKRNSKFLATV